MTRDRVFDRDSCPKTASLFERISVGAIAAAENTDQDFYLAIEERNDMKQGVAALSDAAILYGAQRYFDGVHEDAHSPLRHQFRKEDDRTLFIEFLNNLYLYDRIVLDNRPLESRELKQHNELRTFLRKINSEAGSEIFVGQSFDEEQVNSGRPTATDLPISIQKHICRLVASYVNAGHTSEIEAVTVPWTYHQSFHRDHPAISLAIRDLGIDKQWVPFTLFVWRAIWYGAIAHFESKKNHRPFAYVAAPRRIEALQAVLDAKTLATFQFPRDAVRAIAFDLPGMPQQGYDFSYLDFVSPFELTSLSSKVNDASPLEALRITLGHRASGDARKDREDWANIISSGCSTCSIGTTFVQIMRDVTVHGNATQSVRIRAAPPT
ncbi:hypothetical protein OAH18_01305 [bacterium]|nr:hypothetical protein [bacterium]